MVKENICDKVDRFNRLTKIKKFNSAMYVLLDGYVPTDANCHKKMMYLKGGTTFEDFDHKDESHPLNPCVKCTDYFITSGCEHYRSKTLTALKKNGAVPDSGWRLK